MDSFGTRSDLRIGGNTYEFYSLGRLERAGVATVSRLPYSLKILLENLLRSEDNAFVKADDIRALARREARGGEDYEIAFSPARVLMQDFTGVPAVADLAAMRDAVKKMGGDPARINPLLPAELVIDHSVQVDVYGRESAFLENAELEFARNRERYLFLRWAQKAFDNFAVVPPDTGIVHQVNLELLARVVFSKPGSKGKTTLFPDTLVGTDSHTTMINSIGVLGWGVGGIEAEAAMLGQPISMLIPEVIGFRLKGQLQPGVTATDAVLTVTQMLRKKGVVGKFVEFFGEGLANLPAADRAVIANMAPEYGATCGIFPVDGQTLDYLRLTGRPGEQVRVVEAYCKEQGLFRTEATPDAEYSEVLELNLAEVEPSLAGPRRPHDRVLLREAKQRWREALEQLRQAPKAAGKPAAAAVVQGRAQGVAVAAQPQPEKEEVDNGSVVIAAITSCTNTSNPPLLLAAGLLAKKAVERGLRSKPWVKTSLAPGSKVVTEYLKASGLAEPLEKLGFYLVGYGCTTCIGNSGPLPGPVTDAVRERDLVVCAVLSGNRNFEGRIQALVRANYLASPPLVVAYALAGRMDIDLNQEPLGWEKDGAPVYLRDIWPSPQEIQQAMTSVTAELFQRANQDVFAGSSHWQSLEVPGGGLFEWDPTSTYIKRPPFFEDLPAEPGPLQDVRGSRVLALLGDSVTTDHISPAGSIPQASPAGQYLISLGVKPIDFNSYGARRGNHEVMMRGTFGNIRLRNQLVPGVEGYFTAHLPDGGKMAIYDAAMKYAAERVPLIIVAGKEYGSGSSRDWAAKGTLLLGVRAVLAESFERIHRSNLVGMGVLPLQFPDGENAVSLGLTGRETFDIEGIAAGMKPGKKLTVRARRDDGGEKRFAAIARIDTPQELGYYRHGGILQMVLRQLVGRK
jgi:aconitate hydratase